MMMYVQPPSSECGQCGPTNAKPQCVASAYSVSYPQVRFYGVPFGVSGWAYSVVYGYGVRWLGPVGVPLV